MHSELLYCLITNIQHYSINNFYNGGINNLTVQAVKNTLRIK